MNFFTQNPHLTQSEPGKIDPMCTPDPCAREPLRVFRGTQPSQTLSTSGILITVLDL